MFYLSKATQHQADVAQMAYFSNQEVDSHFMSDILQELSVEKAWIPKRFHKAIDSGTIHTDIKQWQDYLMWCETVIANHQVQCEAIYKNRLIIATKFEQAAAEVFNDSLHDGEIVHVARNDNMVTLLLDMRGGFTPKSMIHLTFNGASEMGELARDYVYDELIETKSGYALRVLSGHPYCEWTIEFNNAEAKFVFRPKAYSEREHYKDINSYVRDLTPTLNYFIIEKYDFVAINIKQIEQREDGFYCVDAWLGENVEQAIDRIYCDAYEDAYAHFSEMVPLEELEQAALSDDPVLRVRAFNTMFEIDEQAATIVNRVLRVIQVEAHEEMLLQVIASHFNKRALLDADVKVRWLS